MKLLGLHGHSGSNIRGPQESAGGPNEHGVYGLVKNFTNNEGADIELGDVVMIDTSGDELIKLTTTLSEPLVTGVVAGAGPYADGARVPILIMGFHPAVKVAGSVAAGDYITASNTDGAAETEAVPGAGSFGRAVSADSSGTIGAIIFEPSLGAGASGPATQITETGGPTDLDIAAIPDGYFLRRVGTDVIGDIPSGGGISYSPARAPASPSALDDEFDDLSLAAKWTAGSSGAGSTGTVNETDRKGFVHTNVNDGGGGSARWIDQSPATAVPAGLWTMVARVFGAVGYAGSNQVNIELYGGATLRFACGMLNGTQAIINGPAGFTAHNRTYITGNFGEIWLMIRHDSGTGIDGWVSGDGMIWTRLTGMTSAGTVTLIRLVAVAFSASNAEAWWDFFRYFPGVNTFDIGGTP